MKDRYALREPSGEYFKLWGNIGWEFTDDINSATQFKGLKKAKKMKNIVSIMVLETYWDYDDIIPRPTIVLNKYYQKKGR